MIEAVRIPETSMYFLETRAATYQKAVIFLIPPRDNLRSHTISYLLRSGVCRVCPSVDTVYNGRPVRLLTGRYWRRCFGCLITFIFYSMILEWSSARITPKKPWSSDLEFFHVLLIFQFKHMYLFASLEKLDIGWTEDLTVNIWTVLRFVIWQFVETMWMHLKSF